MSLRINSNFAAMSGVALRSQRNYQSQMGKSISHISTGLRYSNASDDAAAYVSGKRLKVDAAGYDALDTGLQNSASYISAADGAASSLTDILTSMKEKALSYVALSSADKSGKAGAALSAEYEALKGQLATVEGFTMNGKTLLDAQTFSIGNSISGGTYNVGWAQLSTKITTASSSSIDASGVIAGIQSDIDNVVGEQIKMSAGLSALEQLSSYLQAAASAHDNAYTTLTEVDIAKEMTNYVKNNIYSQAAQAMNAQANQSLAQVLNLLQ